MTHELDTLEDGTLAMFSVRETPWHRGGNLLTSAPNLEEALRLSGTDFDVELQQLSRLLPDGGYEPVDAFASVRTDRGTVLGTVGKRYTPLQNHDAWRVLEPIVDSGAATFETGGSLRGGADCWMMLRLNLPARITDAMEGEVVPFAFIHNSHDGSRAVTLQNTQVRIVCANTLGMALGKRGTGAMKVRHTASVASKTVEAARELWKGIIERQERMVLQYAALKETFLTEEEFRRVVLDVIAPEHKAGKIPVEQRTGHQEGSIRRANERRQKIRAMWEEGAGHTGDHSAWEAYNAVVESVDHDGETWRAKDRLDALSGGRLAKVKQDALESIYSFATVR